jgi:uncharacterized membrane protein YkvA (DUF1232 family)
MGWAGWLLAAAGASLALYAAAVGVLVAAGRGEDARALGGFVPDCVVLVRRLAGDARVPRRHKLLLALVAGYLVLPIDLVPDFVPVAGQLDDVLVVVLALRAVLRAAGPDVVAGHWPGPERSLGLLLRAVDGRLGWRRPRAGTR